MRRAWLFLALVVAPAAAGAQSSQFGIRGLGLPGRPLSGRAFATGGAFALFDGQTPVNPAALAELETVTAGFTVLQDYRHVENPAGTASLRETRFPRFAVASPVRTSQAVLGLSFANYASRDFSLANPDTIVLRGQVIPTTDTLTSKGGLGDLGFSGAYRLGARGAIGAAFHIITGTNRLTQSVGFEDTLYRTARQSTELSFLGAGVSVGVTEQLGKTLAVAAVARWDSHASLERDSARAGSVDLPYSFGLGLKWRARPKLDLATQVQYRTWSGANSDLIQLGGIGSENTFEVAFGGEYIPDLRRPGRRPLRFGARYGTLPFPFVLGDQPHEAAVSLGSGLSFAHDRAGIDVGLEHVWRSSTGFSERSFLLDFGVTVRP